MTEPSGTQVPGASPDSPSRPSPPSPWPGVALTVAGLAAIVATVATIGAPPLRFGTTEIPGACYVLACIAIGLWPNSIRDLLPFFRKS